VTIVDEAGRMLTADVRDDAGLATGAGAIEYQRAIEHAAEERIESLLATLVGAGKVTARVAASVDFSRTERTEETYDPDKTAIRETHSTRDETARAKAVGGAPAADATPGARSDETQRYEVSKTVSRTVAPTGTVKNLSVAVLVDGTYRDENGKRVFVPRGDDELEKLKALVASAVGIDEARGDRLEITSAPFQTAEPEVRSDVLSRLPAWLPALVGRLLGAGLVLGALVLLARSVVQAIATAAATQPRPTGLVVDRDTAVSELARENLALAQQHPERAAQLVRQWLLERQGGTV